MSDANLLRRKIRLCTWIMIIGLVIAGATAIPLQWQADVAARVLQVEHLETAPATSSPMVQWLVKVRTALHEVNQRHPFMMYGADWLAFGHFVIAIAFIGALRDPVRNAWLFQFGMIACALIIPYAFLFGALRGIPIWWRLFDCSFGVVGFLPVWLAHGWTRQLEQAGRHPMSE